MIKSAILLLNTIALLMYQMFFAGDITVSQKAPASAKPDTEFTVELTIKKGSTTGFAKLQQELPEGFTAVEDKSNGASFTFNNQNVKFIWMSLPNDAEFKVTYKVKVAEGISGDQSIAGKFSYVTDNTKQSVDIDAVTVNVSGEGSGNATASTKSTKTTTDDSSSDNSSSDDNSSSNDNSTTKSTTTTSSSDDNSSSTTTASSNNTSTSSNGDGSFSCIRNVPENVSGDFVVEINVSKGNLGGFAKLLETLPAGYTASSMESAGGSFSFADSKVRFIWVSLPAQPEFKISYKVKVPKGASGSQSIDGTFSYIEDDNTRKYTMPTNTFTIGGGGAVASNNTKSNTNSNSNSNNTDNSLSANNITAPQSGVVYKVQVMALQNNRPATYVASYCHLSSSSVEKAQEEGLNKYRIKTPYTDYKSARDARENARSRGVVSPFVVAFNSGSKITVQQALMTTNQTWYR